MLGKLRYVKNIIAAVGFGLQWSSRRPESRCVSVGTLYVHVSPLTRSRLFPRRREGCREWEWGERGGGGGGRGNSAALPSDCVVKGVQPSPVGPHTRGLRGDRGEGNQPASVTHPPLMLRSIPQTQSQIATGAPHSSSSPHRLLIILTATDSRIGWEWCETWRSSVAGWFVMFSCWWSSEWLNVWRAAMFIPPSHT